MARRHDLRRYYRHQADDETAEHGAHERAQPEPREHVLADRHAPHQNDAQHRREQAERGGKHDIVTGDGHLLGTDHAELGRLELSRDEIAHQRRDADRRQTVRRIAADDQLEAVKGAGERRAECAGNAGGGAAADQDAQVAAAQPKRIADARGDAAGKLRVAGLEADRCADPARPHRLRRNDDAAEERHPAAVQRIGFDRIDFPLRPPATDDLAGRAHDHAADERHRQRRDRD